MSAEQLQVLAEWEDERVQIVYQILCSKDAPPPAEHWEGFCARRIVAALEAIEGAK